MSAYRQQINPLLFRAYLKFAVCLNCIHMKIGFWVFILNTAGNLLHRLHSADFIINVHYGYQNRISPYRLLKLRQGNAAKGINWKIGNFKALFLQPGHCIIYGRMFHRACNQMFSCPLIRQGRPNQRQVVRFCPS